MVILEHETEIHGGDVPSSFVERIGFAIEYSGDEGMIERREIVVLAIDNNRRFVDGSGKVSVRRSAAYGLVEAERKETNASHTAEND